MRTFWAFLPLQSHAPLWYRPRFGCVVKSSLVDAVGEQVIRRNMTRETCWVHSGVFVCVFGVIVPRLEILLFHNLTAKKRFVLFILSCVLLSFEFEGSSLC